MDELYEDHENYEAWLDQLQQEERRQLENDGKESTIKGTLS